MDKESPKRLTEYEPPMAEYDTTSEESMDGGSDAEPGDDSARSLRATTKLDDATAGFSGSFNIAAKTKVYLGIIRMSGSIHVANGSVAIDIHASSGVSIVGDRSYGLTYSEDGIGHASLNDNRFGSLKRTEVTSITYYPDTDTVLICARWKSKLLTVPVEVLFGRADS